jgi:hypothetical protein
MRFFGLHERPRTATNLHELQDPYAFLEHTGTPKKEPDEEPTPAGYDELTDDEVAAAARAWWLDDLCERCDADHDDGPESFVLY